MSFLTALARPRGIARRLVLTLALIALVGAIAGWLVALAVGPALFSSHLVEAGSSPGTTFEHAKAAFTSASTLTLAVALAASAATSLGVGLSVARRIAASLNTMSDAAARVAAGHYEQRVDPPAIGSEFDQLAEAFNDMASQLDDNEALRRRLMSDVAHELRTPVATIAALMDAVEDGIRTFDADTVEVLRAQSSRLTRLADDLAAVTRAESGAVPLELQRTSVAQLLGHAADSARDRYALSGVTLSVRVAPDVLTVQADTDRFGQVLANLLDNALRHTPAGGEVSMTAENEAQGVRLTVADNGEGIAASDLTHVFERFYRVDPARTRAQGGSGIGLTITRAIVHAHGGTITAHSDGPGAGARFVIALPASRAGADEPDGPPARPAAS